MHVKECLQWVRCVLRAPRWVAALMPIWLAAPAIAQWPHHGGVTDGSPKRFLFDAANASHFAAEGTEFSRSVATIDPAGNAVPADVPRFDGPVLLPSIGVPELVPVGMDVFADGQILGSGVDHDGQTPLMVYLHNEVIWPQQTLYIFSGGTLPTTWYPLPPAHTRTTLHVRSARPDVQPVPCYPGLPSYAFSFVDLFDGEYTTPGGQTKAFWVRDASVFHGAIILSGAVYVFNASASPPGYEFRGTGFALSNDRGHTWSLIGDDVHEPPQPTDEVGWPRARNFCLSAAPIYQRGVAQPNECWFSASDYRVNDCGSGAQVGRALMFKLTRTDPTSDWQPGPVSYFEVSGTLNHMHSCQITEYGVPPAPRGLQMVASVGDTKGRGRFLRWVLPDLSQDYSDPSNWAPAPLSTDDYHGAHTDITQSPPLPGSLSSQPTSASFGPAPGTILWGTDTMSDWLSMMELPLDGPGQARLHQIYGMAASAGADSASQEGARLIPQCAILENPRPELAGPALSILTSADSAEVPAVRAMVRLLYCPSLSLQPDTWTQVAGIHQGSATCALYGGYIYYTSEVASFGLWRVPEPQVRTYRPVLVGPGGTNLISAASFVDAQGPGSFEPLAPGSSPGEWLDQGRVIRAPVMSDRVYRLRTSRAAGGTLAATLRPSASMANGIAGAWANPGLPWYAGSDSYGRSIQRIRRFRGWMLDGTYDDGTHTVGTTPNKTSRLSAALCAGDGSADRDSVEIRYAGCDRWCPITIIGHRALSDGSASPGLGLRLGTIDPDDNYLYFALDQAMEGNGSIGYPQPPQTGPTPFQAPDERLSVSHLGLNCGQNWLFRIAGMQPMGNWDQFSDRGRQTDGGWRSDRTWPLFTLWAGPDSYIEFLADCNSRGYLVKAKVSGQDVDSVSFGSGQQVWLPESPLMVAIAYDSTHQKLVVGASLGGDAVRTATLDLEPDWGQLTFDTLRFSGSGGGLYGTRPEVVEYRWIGGEADPAPTMLPTTQNIKSCFSDLTFLGAR